MGAGVRARDGKSLWREELAEPGEISAQWSGPRFLSPVGEEREGWGKGSSPARSPDPERS